MAVDQSQLSAVLSYSNYTRNRRYLWPEYRHGDIVMTDCRLLTALWPFDHMCYCRFSIPTRRHTLEKGLSTLMALLKLPGAGVVVLECNDHSHICVSNLFPSAFGQQTRSVTSRCLPHKIVPMVAYQRHLATICQRPPF